MIDIHMYMYMHICPMVTLACTPPNKSFPPGPSFAVNRVPFCPEAANQSENPARDSTSVHVTAELA
jgi:hypothetical protein